MSFHEQQCGADRLRCRTSVSIAAALFAAFLHGENLPAQGLADPLPAMLAAADSTSPATIEPAPLADPTIATLSYEPALPSASGPQVETLSATGEPREIRATPRRFHYALALDVRASYDDNISLAQNHKIDGTFLRFQALLTLGLGDIEGREGNYLRLDYTPSAFLYLDNSDFNTIDHLVKLEGYHRFSRLALTFSQDIQSSQSSSIETANTSGTFINGASVDTGGRRRLTSYGTRANASYDLTGKTSLTGGLSYSATDYGSLISSQTIAGTIAIDYRYGPKLTFGLAGTAGKNLVDAPSPDQTFEQLNLRGTYEVTGKVSANASAGVEVRQLASGANDHVSPVFELGLTYLPFDGTSLNLTASRQTLNSSTLAGEDFSSTQFVATFRQRLFRRFSVGLSGGYQNLSYFSAVNGRTTNREDNYSFVQPSLDVKLTNFWSAGVYYLHRDNQSSLSSFGFNENQVGFHSGIRF